MVLRPMPFAEVRVKWSAIRVGLEHCRARTAERWMPEDIYATLRDGSSGCYAISKGERDVGFLVAQRHVDPDGPVLFVWAISTERGSVIAEREALWQEILGLAAHIGAKRIRMESPRKGWEWVDFFVPVRVVYEHEINYAVKREAA